MTDAIVEVFETARELKPIRSNPRFGRAVARIRREISRTAGSR